MANSKILFLVPDGVGIRNYLYSSLISNLNGCDIAILSSLPREAFYEVAADFEYYPLTFAKEGFLSRTAREAATYARLCFNARKVNNPTILKNWNYAPKGLRLKVLSKIAVLLGKTTSGNYPAILWLEKKAKVNWSSRVIAQYKKQLQEIQPTAIFITHQRVASLMPICIAAKELHIPVVAAVYSWDNLPKGRLAVAADKYVVWSEHMKNEMNLFYPEISSEQIVVTGTPQFEFYLQHDKITDRETFARQFGLAMERPWICFSGDDVKTSPYDPEYLHDLASAVALMDEAVRPQILFRRCPVDFSSRYDAVLSRFPTIIKPVDPVWNVPNNIENWGVFFPKKEDIAMQVNLAFHCDAVVNLGSTMAHDFAMFDKPCFYFNYDPVAGSEWSVKTIYNYQHFRSMDGLDAVGWLNSKEAILPELEKLFSGVPVAGTERKLWLEKIVLHPVEKASQHIAKVLKNCNE